VGDDPVRRPVIDRADAKARRLQTPEARLDQHRRLVRVPFGRWSEVFLDTGTAAAVIDRIVHHATVIATEGESYRLQDANARARRGAAAREQEVRPA
jgi:hypothetical protein